MQLNILEIVVILYCRGSVQTAQVQNKNLPSPFNKITFLLSYVILLNIFQDTNKKFFKNYIRSSNQQQSINVFTEYSYNRYTQYFKTYS